MKIKDLFPSVPSIGQDSSVSGLTSDSRDVQKGDLFIAILCDQMIPHILCAWEKGAKAIVIDSLFLEHNKTRLPQGVYIPVSNARQSLFELARKFYPQHPPIIASVTGTNGKSSVTTFVQQIWELLGKKGASFGTLGVQPFKYHPPFSLPPLTTPDSLSLHKLLHYLKEEKVDRFVFEASSHGLHQYRLHGARVTVAGFTNLTQDHLDYHKTMDAYFEAKSRLFTDILIPEGSAVINKKGLYAKSLRLLIQSSGLKLMTYSVGEETADLFVPYIKTHQGGLLFDIHYRGKVWENISLPLKGTFQVENVLCAIGMVMAEEGISLEEIIPLLPQIQSAKGRMQWVGTTKGASIYVDYAHTPDALAHALTSLKDHLEGEGRLHVVFGCGGNRDTAKRQTMGAIADTLADVIYITDDNPRKEDPSFIRMQVLSGCPGAHEIPSRLTAIETAINGLEGGDLLLIAGKGHEQGQMIGCDILPFDDCSVVQEILKKGMLRQ